MLRRTLFACTAAFTALTPLAAWAQEAAAQQGQGTGTWGLASVLVVLAVALGVFGVVRPGSRTEDFRRPE